MSQFPNVNPLPFLLAQAPRSFPSIVGLRSFDPQLPAIGGYTDADLERMRFALMQSGADPARLGRIRDVIALRGGNAPARAADLESQLLRHTPGKKRAAVGLRALNPFDILADELQQ